MCGLDGHYATMLHVHALANVIGQLVRSVYPSRIKNLMRPLLNCTVHPRTTTKSCEKSVVIMWSSSSLPAEPHSSDMIWKPNHFVPLLPHVESVNGIGGTHVTVKLEIAAEKSTSSTSQVVEKPQQLTLRHFLGPKTVQKQTREATKRQQNIFVTSASEDCVKG